MWRQDAGWWHIAHWAYSAERFPLISTLFLYLHLGSDTTCPRCASPLLHRWISSRRTWKCDRPRGYLSASWLRGTSHSYLAMQHMIHSSGIQMSARTARPSRSFLQSQQIPVWWPVGGALRFCFSLALHLGPYSRGKPWSHASLKEYLRLRYELGKLLQPCFPDVIHSSVCHEVKTACTL